MDINHSNKKNNTPIREFINFEPAGNKLETTNLEDQNEDSS